MIRILYWYWLTWSNASILHALDHICSTNYIMAEKAPSVPWNLCWGNIQPWETRRKRKSNQSNQKKKPRPPDHLNWWSTNLGPPDMISSRTLPDVSSVWVVCETDGQRQIWMLTQFGAEKDLRSCGWYENGWCWCQPPLLQLKVGSSRQHCFHFHVSILPSDRLSSHSHSCLPLLCPLCPDSNSGIHSEFWIIALHNGLERMDLTASSS